MQTWFEVKVKYMKIDQNGRERKVSEVYLVDAVSFTDAETRMTEQLLQIVRGEFHIDSIKKSNIIEMIYPGESGEFWFKAKITIITLDEKTGKEKKVNQYFLICADDMDEAKKRLDAGFNYILVPYHTVALSLSTIVDVFPYFETKVSTDKNMDTEVYTNNA